MEEDNKLTTTTTIEDEIKKEDKECLEYLDKSIPDVNKKTSRKKKFASVAKTIQDLNDKPIIPEQRQEPVIEDLSPKKNVIEKKEDNVNLLKERKTFCYNTEQFLNFEDNYAKIKEYLDSGWKIVDERKTTTEHDITIERN